MISFFVLDKLTGDIKSGPHKTLRLAKESKQDFDQYHRFISDSNGIPFVSRHIIAKTKENSDETVNA